MQVVPSDQGGFERGDEARFTGEVWLRGTAVADDGTNVGLVHFAPDARTRWHRHPGGQFLIGVSGRGRVRTKGAAGHLLEPGDVVHVTADEWDFHWGCGGPPMGPGAVTGAAAPFAGRTDVSAQGGAVNPTPPPARDLRYPLPPTWNRELRQLAPNVYAYTQGGGPDMSGGGGAALAP